MYGILSIASKDMISEELARDVWVDILSRRLLQQQRVRLVISPTQPASISITALNEDAKLAKVTGISEG